MSPIEQTGGFAEEVPGTEQRNGDSAVWFLDDHLARAALDEKNGVAGLLLVDDDSASRHCKLTRPPGKAPECRLWKGKEKGCSLQNRDAFEHRVDRRPVVYGGCTRPGVPRAFTAEDGGPVLGTYAPIPPEWDAGAHLAAHSLRTPIPS